MEERRPSADWMIPVSMRRLPRFPNELVAAAPVQPDFCDEVNYQLELKPNEDEKNFLSCRGCMCFGQRGGLCDRGIKILSREPLRAVSISRRPARYHPPHGCDR